MELLLPGAVGVLAIFALCYHNLGDWLGCGLIALKGLVGRGFSVAPSPQDHGGAGIWPAALPRAPALRFTPLKPGGAGVWAAFPHPRPCGVRFGLPRPPNKAPRWGGGDRDPSCRIGPALEDRVSMVAAAPARLARLTSSRGARRAVAAVTAAMEGGGRPSAVQAALLAASTALTALLYSVYRQKARVARGLQVGARGPLGFGDRRGPGPRPRPSPVG